MQVSPDGFFPFGADLRHDFRRRQAHGKGKSEFHVERLFDPGCNLWIRALEWALQSREIRETFINTVLLDVRGIAAHDRKHPFRQQAVGFIIGREEDYLRTVAFDLRDPHAPRDPTGLGLIAHRGGNPPFFPGDDGFAFQGRVPRLFTGRKKRIGVDMHNGPGQMLNRERRRHLSISG